MPTEARAVAQAAIDSGVARIDVDPDWVHHYTAYLRDVLDKRYAFFEQYVQEHPFRG